MATRTYVREVVIGLLYAYECGNTNIAQNAPKILDERKIKNKQQIFALALLNWYTQESRSDQYVFRRNTQRVGIHPTWTNGEEYFATWCV